MEINAWFYTATDSAFGCMGEVVNSQKITIDGVDYYPSEGDVIYLNKRPKGLKINFITRKKREPVYRDLTCTDVAGRQELKLRVDVANVIRSERSFWYKAINGKYIYTLTSNIQPLEIKDNTLRCFGIVKREKPMV
jgi:hypothetical protein